MDVAGLRRQEDSSYVGTHLNCALHVNTGSFPQGRWSPAELVAFAEVYDGPIELTIAAIDSRITTFVNGQQVAMFDSDLGAGGMLLRHDGPFVLHKLEFMNLDEQGEEK